MRALLLVVVGSACATTPRGPPPLRPVERSSIDAVLRHRAELNLTDAQVARLEDLDDAREREEADLVAHADADPVAQPEALPPVGSGLQGRRRAGEGPPERGSGPASGPPPGGRAPPQDPRRPDGLTSRDRLQSRLDDADTQAFVAAVEALDPPQRDGARRIASKYRELLFEFRAATRRSGRPGTP